MYGLGDLIDELRADNERLQRENAALRHELTAVKNTLEAVGREKDEIERKLLLQIGSMSAQDAREQIAGDKCGVPYAEHGCDWPDAVADVVLTLRRDAERWRECDWNAEQMHMGGGWGYCIDVEWRESFTAAIDAAIAKRKETT